MLHCSNVRNIGSSKVDVKKNGALQQNNLKATQFSGLQIETTMEKLPGLRRLVRLYIAIFLTALL